MRKYLGFLIIVLIVIILIHTRSIDATRLGNANSSGLIDLATGVTGVLAPANGGAGGTTTGSAMPHFTLNRRWGICSLLGLGDGSFTCWGTSGATTVTNVFGSGSVTSVASGRSRWLRYTTGTSSGNFTSSGMTNCTQITSNGGGAYFDPIVMVKIKTDTTITSTRLWVGFMQGANVNDYTGFYSTSTTTSSANAVMIAVGYDTGGSANTANFHFNSADGSGSANTVNDIDTGIAVQASTEYYITVDCRNAETTGCVATINNTSTSMPTVKITSLNLSLCGGAQIRTLTNAARNLYVENFTVEQN